MNNENKNGAFFEQFQKKNVMVYLQRTVENILNKWLKNDGINQEKATLLQNIIELPINSDKFPKSQIPEFITCLWYDSRHTMGALDKSISENEVRGLIKRASTNVIEKVPVPSERF